MKTMYEDIPKLLQSLADRFCERRAYSCLLRFLPAYFSPNGLTDGWEDCRAALAETRALCRDQLKPDEERDLHKAMNLIDRMLADRGRKTANQSASTLAFANKKMILRMTESDGWKLGPDTCEHLMDVDASGRVIRVIDLDKHGNIADAAPTPENPHGAIDHAPLDMKCDWSGSTYPLESFEMLWKKADK